MCVFFHSTNQFSNPFDTNWVKVQLVLMVSAQDVKLHKDSTAWECLYCRFQSYMWCPGYAHCCLSWLHITIRASSGLKTFWTGSENWEHHLTTASLSWRILLKSHQMQQRYRPRSEPHFKASVPSLGTLPSGTSTCRPILPKSLFV